MLCAFVVLASMVTACGSSASSTVPGGIPLVPGPMPSVYTGQIHDSVNDDGVLRMSVSTVLDVSSGTWDMVFPGSTDRATRYWSGEIDKGVLTGTVSQSTPDGRSVFAPDCQLSVTATVSGVNLSGSYSSIPVPTCPVRTGTFTLALNGSL
jgi:hypothetical protein